MTCPDRGAPAALERRGALGVNDAVQRWLSTNPAPGRPGPPVERGSVTIADVLAAGDPDEHGREVLRWAASAYASYGAHHGRAREWIARVTACRQAVR